MGGTSGGGAQSTWARVLARVRGVRSRPGTSKSRKTSWRRSRSFQGQAVGEGVTTVGPEAWCCIVHVWGPAGADQQPGSGSSFSLRSWKKHANDGHHR